jgi:hypothetical protein
MAENFRDMNYTDFENWYGNSGAKRVNKSTYVIRGDNAYIVMYYNHRKLGLTIIILKDTDGLDLCTTKYLLHIGTYNKSTLKVLNNFLPENIEVREINGTWVVHETYHNEYVDYMNGMTIRDEYPWYILPVGEQT